MLAIENIASDDNTFVFIDLRGLESVYVHSNQ